MRPPTDESAAWSRAGDGFPVLEVMPGRPWRDLGDRIVLFDQREGEETGLSGSAVLLWRMIVPRRLAAEVVGELRTVLGDTAEFAEATAFVDRLVESGILRRV